MNIYKITNLLNNNIYIGQELQYHPDYFGSGLLIKRAIKKYGIKNFNKEIIETCESRTELDDKEIYWISHYNSIAPNGYNICKGGNGGDTFSNNPRKEQIRQSMSKRYIGKNNPMYGRRHTQKAKKQISKNKKGQRKGIPTWNKGKKMPKEWREERSRKYSRSGNPQAKTFILTDPNGNKHTVIGSLDHFCKKHNLPATTMRSYINKGVIPSPSRKPSKKRKNMTGWEIILDLQNQDS